MKASKVAAVSSICRAGELSTGHNLFSCFTMAVQCSKFWCITSPMIAGLPTIYLYFCLAQRDTRPEASPKMLCFLILLASKGRVSVNVCTPSSPVPFREFFHRSETCQLWLSGIEKEICLLAGDHLQSVASIGRSRKQTSNSRSFCTTFASTLWEYHPES